MSSGYAIELNEKFDWNEDSILVFTTHGCTVIQQGRCELGEVPFFMLLEFHKAKCVRSVSSDCAPDVGIYPENRAKSSIAALSESNWDTEAHDKYTYTGTPKRVNRKHYVVSNHDIFHEILAESFTEKKISNTNSGYEKIKSLYLLSKAKIV